MKGVLILSGGIDSVTLLYHLKRQGWDIDVLTFDYGSKHNAREIPYAKKHTEGHTHRIISLSFINDLFKSKLLQSGGPVPEAHQPQEELNKIVVPYRNGIMLSIAIGYAESIGAECVFIGSNADDRTGFPDCRWEFIQEQSLTAALGTFTRVTVRAPFNNMTKEEIVKLGYSLGINYDDTWTCYAGTERPCGVCASCVLREQALAKIRKED